MGIEGIYLNIVKAYMISLQQTFGEGNGNPLQYSCLENSCTEEPSRLYSPWGHKESNMTERLSHTHTANIILNGKKSKAFPLRSEIR